MRELTIALALIEQGDRYLLQLRGDNPAIGAAGLLGCFAGKLEEGELPHDAVVREVGEETSFQGQPKDFELLGEVKVTSDHKLEAVKIRGYAYRLKLLADVAIEAYEGTMVALPRKQVPDQLGQMTPATRAIFEQFVLNGDK